MEGGPVFDRHASLAGILTRPIRQKGSNAEIQFAITWNAMASIHIKCLHLEAYNTDNGVLDRNKFNDHSSSWESSDSGLCKKMIRKNVIWSPESPLESAISSIVLVAVGEGSWASGILLNNCGLILTNAHTLEPWRFGRTSNLGSIGKATSQTEHETPLGQQVENSIDEETGSNLPQRMGNCSSFHSEPFLGFRHGNSRRISVRLDFMEQKSWYSAQAVYVSKGPLDVALLQLESVPPQLIPIIPQLACPSEGTVVHVIGHGLLGPRSNISASVSSGVLSKVVEVPRPIHLYESSKSEERMISYPIMLQTTAAVHPGASGGAVINSKGHILGLITSNARHGGGTIIPHLNFSIPCAALEPVFKFSETQDASVLEILDKPNELLSLVWALVPTDSKKQVDELENQNYGKGKGLRFSQFIAEQKAKINGLREPDHLQRSKLPSKI